MKTSLSTSVSGILLHTDEKVHTFFRVDKILFYTAGINAALVYAHIREQSIYHAEKAIKNDGWIEMPLKKICDAVRLTRHPADKAIQTLNELELLQITFDRKKTTAPIYKLLAYRIIDEETIKPIKNTWVRILHAARLAEKDTPNAVGVSEKDTPVSGNSPYCSNEKKPVLESTKNINTKDKEKKEEKAPSSFLEDLDFKKLNCTEEEFLFVEQCIKKIQNNHPKAVTPQSAPLKIQQGIIAVRKLTKQYNDFPFVCSVITWGLNHPFWKKVLLSLAELPKIKTGKDTSKFEQIATQYETAQKDPVEEFDLTVENAINKIVESNEYYKDCDINIVYNECSQFFDMLEELSENISPNRHKFNWYTCADKFIETLKWGLKVDADLFPYREVTNWIILAEKYIEFLKYRLQDNTINTIHAGMFKSDSMLFTRFINDLSAQWGRRILNTQPDMWG